MSTRTLRKLQREREQDAQIGALQARDSNDESDESGEDSIPFAVQAKGRKKAKNNNKLNPFQMLEQEKEAEDAPLSESGNESERPDAVSNQGDVTPGSAKTKKQKKKNKAKAKGTERGSVSGSKAIDEASSRNRDEADEIDRALHELNLRKKIAAHQVHKGAKTGEAAAKDSWEGSVSKLLSIDPRNLNPTNEMRSLFGTIALERTTRNPQRANEDGRVDLETALDGQHSPVSRGRELGSIAKRRNLFMQGQENWPLATSGGLGMQLVKDQEDSGPHPQSANPPGKKYEIVHNSAYEDTQRHFRQAVESMSPDNMIHLLIYHPYHIATLLQVAEIAKHQGDHSVTGDLLERALFTFGRSVHSTFGVSVREGRARLSFDKPANRELYLAIWRYVQNLEMRGTWRTAFEWSKMLLSFNILSDPYGITHSLDQYALRGRQHAAFIALCADEAFGKTWAHLPNMQISLALAYHRASEPRLARQKLALAMHRYPYILSHLCSTLEISPLPKYLWGKTPATDAEKLYTALYVIRAKDLWATPETTALVVEVADTMDSYSSYWQNAAQAPKLEVSLEDARHVLLLDIPELIALIPRTLRSLPTAQYDVLPPPSAAGDVGLTARAPATAGGPAPRGAIGYLAEIMRAASMVFLGADSDGNGATNTNDNLDPDYEAAGPGAVPHHEDQDDETLAQDFFHATVGDPTLSTADRLAILNALADGSSDTESQPSDDHEEEDEEEEEPDQDFFGAAEYMRHAPDGTDDSSSSSSPPQHHNPPAPTVEDDNNDDDDNNHITRSSGLLPASSSSSTMRQFPHLPTPAMPTQTLRQNRSREDAEIDSSPQRIQRYLLSTGLAAISGPNTNNSATGAMDDYVRRLRLLGYRDREWVLGAVRQRVNADAGVAVKGGEGEKGEGDADGEGKGKGKGKGKGNGEQLVERIRRAAGL